MNNWLNSLVNSDFGPSVGTWEDRALVLVFSFALGHFIGFLYMWTHEAISYSRTFVASLAILPVLIALMMMVMSGNMLVAFGLLAVFGIIRFRNVLKDTRDTVFLLWAIMEGVAVGTLRHSTALLGAIGIATILAYLRLTSFGIRHRFDAVLTLRMTGELLSVHKRLKATLRPHVLRAKLISERRSSDGGIDVSYQLLLRDPGRFDRIQLVLATVEGISNVAVFLHEDEAEI